MSRLEDDRHSRTIASAVLYQRLRQTGANDEIQDQSRAIRQVERADGPRGQQAASGGLGRGARSRRRRLAQDHRPAWSASVWDVQLLEDDERDELRGAEVRSCRDRKQ